MNYYELTNLAKRNLYDYISAQFISLGETVEVLDAYPLEETFTRPALSIEFDDFFEILPTDMGYTDEVIDYSFILDLFAVDSFQRDKLVASLLEMFKNVSISMLNYNEATPTFYGYMRVISADATPLRVETPTGEETKRAKITVMVEIYKQIL